MSFNTTSSLLCVTSASDTVHIFKLGGSQRRASTDHSPPSSSHSEMKERDRSLSPAASDSQADFAGGYRDGDDKQPPFSLAAAARKHNGTLMGMIRRTSQTFGSTLATSVGAYLPSAVAEMWEPARDFAWCKIPKSPGGASPSSPNPGSPGIASSSASQLRSVVAMSNNSPQVMIVTNEGHFYVFGIDLENGGEGALVKVYEVGGESEKIGTGAMDE